jgi:hypothetical protein
MVAAAFVINVGGDSVHVFDARTSQLTMAFHPGGEGLRLAVSSRGDVAASWPAAKHAYVFREPR